MQLRAEDLYIIEKSVKYCRDTLTGNDYMWDRYDEVLERIKNYRNNYEPDS